MKPFRMLVGKHLHDTRWSLVLSAAALFGLGWLFVFVTALNEQRFLERLSSSDQDVQNQMRWMRNLGVTESPSSASLIVLSWSHPFIFFLISMWAIGRGSAAIAAEIERGTMDLLLSRPIGRGTYLAAQVVVAIAGLVVLPGGLLAGAAFAIRFNTLREPPTVAVLMLPALNLAALGLPIYGYTLFASAFDHVRWRPNSIGAGLTAAGFVAYVVSIVPVLDDWKWRPWFERVSIFKAYNPVELVTTGETLARNAAILGGIGAGCIAAAFVVFAIRDLPANA